MHLAFDHRPWSHGPSRRSYRIEASLEICTTNGWSTTNTVGHHVRKVMAQVDGPTMAWDHPAPRFLRARFFAVMRAESRLESRRDPLEPDDPWLPTRGSPS